MCSILATMSKNIDRQKLKEAFDRTIPRGPDMSRLIETPIGFIGFHRLAIMGLNENGMQPFELDGDIVVCNGEIYGFRKMKEELINKGYQFKSESDCEILLPLFREYGTEMFGMLGSEFACVIYDHVSETLIAARDPIGIRPLYYGELADGALMFASEPCNLVGLCETIKPFPPGHLYLNGEFVSYMDISQPAQMGETEVEAACRGIHDKLAKSIEERLDSDAPLGFLLSGGLDSSLVCGMAAKLMPGKKIRTFAIGMEQDAIDLKYAREVADYIDSDHTEVFMTPEDVIRELPNVIKLLGTWDITTIRASMGMYLCCKWIHEHTDVRVLMTGEISDELFGYKYTDFAPDAESFQAEAAKRVHELHMYDVLRADRCISANSLEARVPFGDTEFVKYVMAIDPKIKINNAASQKERCIADPEYGKDMKNPHKYAMGKYLLRHAFEKDELIPEDILWREKAAFSDAVGHSMVDDLKEYAESRYSDEEFETKRMQYTYCTPFTKESLLYREIFEEYYPGQAQMIKDFWMPNKSWVGCNVDDPSARVLSNYGASGV